MAEFRELVSDMEKRQRKDKRSSITNSYSKEYRRIGPKLANVGSRRRNDSRKFDLATGRAGSSSTVMNKD